MTSRLVFLNGELPLSRMIPNMTTEFRRNTYHEDEARSRFLVGIGSTLVGSTTASAVPFFKN